MEETKVDVTAVAEKPAKRTYNRQKKAATEVKAEAVEATKDTEFIEVEAAAETPEAEIKVANEEKKTKTKPAEKKEDVKAEVKEEAVAEKPAEKVEEVVAVLSIEKPEIGSNEPDLKASYLIRRPVPLYFVPKVSERCKMFVGVVRVLSKVDDKFVKIAYRDSGSGEDVIAYMLTSALLQ